MLRKKVWISACRSASGAEGDNHASKRSKRNCVFVAARCNIVAYPIKTASTFDRASEGSSVGASDIMYSVTPKTVKRHTWHSKAEHSVSRIIPLHTCTTTIYIDLRQYGDDLNQLSSWRSYTTLSHFRFFVITFDDRCTTEAACGRLLKRHVCFLPFIFHSRSALLYCYALEPMNSTNRMRTYSFTSGFCNIA